MPNEQERRQYKRIKKNFIVRYFDKAHSDVKYEATQIKNISLGGICLITQRSFPSACELRIELKTPFQAETTELEGVVLESHEKVSGVIYETRMKLCNVTPQNDFVLRKLIEHFEKEEGQAK